ncbi:MAG: FliA/WhiG family RNA polymerase sigma factor [Firmicutes bacterium]|jgi:RNA polymerase sigma factor for flagellar operon FliA|nr:FliA/WhiG family RNA polymerase sigma factor [Bacillota bacterium]
MNHVRTYREKNGAASAETVARYLPLVRYHAGRLLLGLPAHINKEDLVQAGVLGLLEALKRFDPARGVKFETYASLRIRGAMLDELRSLSWLPRSLFRQMRALNTAEQKLAASLGREPTDEELAAELNMPQEKYRKLTAAINTAATVSLEEVLFAAPPTNATEEFVLDRIIAEEEKERLAAAIAALPERYRQLLALYYQEGLTLKEVGLVLGISESRVCQLHSRIISRLRAVLADS